MLVLISVVVQAGDAEHGYSIVVDCGSTGTRANLYRYTVGDPYASLQSLGRVRVRPGLATFTNASDASLGLSDQLDHLLAFAHEKIPSDYWGNTRFTVRATAGMRKLGTSESDALMSRMTSILETKLASTPEDFQFDKSRSGVITGEEEALYDISAVMVAVKREPEDETRGNKNVGTYGVVDLGGSSMQYAFSESSADDWRDHLYLRSFAGLGLIDSMEEVLKTFFSHSGRGDDHPCLPLGGIPAEGREGVKVRQEKEGEVIPGSGDFRGCVSLIQDTLLPRMLQESAGLCSSNGDEDTEQGEVGAEETHANSHRSTPFTPDVVVGLDNAPSLLFILGLNPYPAGQTVAKVRDVQLVSPAAIAREGERVCSLTWRELLESVDPSSSLHLPSYRGHRACFGSALLLVFLQEIVLRGCGDYDNVTRADHEEGLVLPLQEVGNVGELSWALGAALLDEY